MNRYHCFVSLNVRGDNLDFDAITKILEMNPTKTVRKGDRNRVKSDGWLFRIENEGARLSETMTAMENALEGRVEAVQQLAQVYDIYIWCSHQTNLAMSGFDFTPDNLAFLARLGVRLTVSIMSSGEVITSES